MTLGEIDRVIRVYRNRGVFLDSNLIVLLVVCLVDPALLRRHKRPQDYTEREHETLIAFCKLLSRIVTMPDVLTEAANLLGRGEELALALKAVIDAWQEEPLASKEAAATPEYPYLRLADAAILGKIAGSFLVVSDDGPLVRAVHARKGAALHFDVLRAIAQAY